MQSKSSLLVLAVAATAKPMQLVQEAVSCCIKMHGMVDNFKIKRLLHILCGIK
jgi:hypothetical protein